MRCHEGGGAGTVGAEDASDVVDAVDVDLAQTNGPHPLCDIGSTCSFFKRGRRNTTQMHRFVEHLVKAIR
jgi:hypothetical protein